MRFGSVGSLCFPKEHLSHGMAFTKKTIWLKRSSGSNKLLWLSSYLNLSRLMITRTSNVCLIFPSWQHKGPSSQHEGRHTWKRGHGKQPGEPVFYFRENSTQYTPPTQQTYRKMTTMETSSERLGYKKLHAQLVLMSTKEEQWIKGVITWTHVAVTGYDYKWSIWHFTGT